MFNKKDKIIAELLKDNEINSDQRGNNGTVRRG